MLEGDQEELCRLLALPIGTNLPTALRAYESAREALLDADADHLRPEVRHLDEAFSSFRDAWFAASAATREQQSALERRARYQEARVRVGISNESVLVTPTRDVGQRGGFPFEVDRLHIITACNPGSTRLEEDVNLQRQVQLVDQLEREGLQCWPAVGGDESGSHEEVSVAVAGLSDDAARQIGLVWGQDAVFVWTPESWAVLPCDGSEPQALGWTSTRVPEPMADPVTERRRAGGEQQISPPMAPDENCPRCGQHLLAPPLPPPSSDIAEDAAAGLRDGYDGIPYWQCPSCGHRWHRWSETSPNREFADAFVDADWGGPRIEESHYAAVTWAGDVGESASRFDIAVMAEQPGNAETVELLELRLDEAITLLPQISVDDERRLLGAAAKRLEDREYALESGWWRSRDGYMAAVDFPERVYDEPG